KRCASSMVKPWAAFRPRHGFAPIAGFSSLRVFVATVIACSRPGGPAVLGVAPFRPVTLRPCLSAGLPLFSTAALPCSAVAAKVPASAAAHLNNCEKLAKLYGSRCFIGGNSREYTGFARNCLGS